MMNACNFGAICAGLGVGSSYGKHKNVGAALNLIKELNNHTKFSIGALRVLTRSHPTCAATRSVPTLQGATRGSGPGEYAMVDMLRGRDVDAAFVMCTDLVCHIPADPASYLCEIPLVCLDIAPCPTTIASDVVLPGVIDAMECSGTFYRLDRSPRTARAIPTAASESARTLGWPDRKIRDWEISRYLGAHKGTSDSGHTSLRERPPARSQKFRLADRYGRSDEYISGDLGFRGCSGVFVAPYGVLEHIPCLSPWCRFAQIVPMPPDLPDPVKMFF
ncbi:MAG: hypothetical protein C5S49_06930 [Candidatus Methanogaster sp.]|nr:MAG: hypothetical protein C5S49_06930 [ANME-2 cluster archaeon]